MNIRDCDTLSYLLEQGFVVVYLVDEKKKKVISIKKAEEMAKEGKALPVNDDSAMTFLRLIDYI